MERVVNKQVLTELNRDIDGFKPWAFAVAIPICILAVVLGPF